MLLLAETPVRFATKWTGTSGSYYMVTVMWYPTWSDECVTRWGSFCYCCHGLVCKYKRVRSDWLKAHVSRP